MLHPWLRWRTLSPCLHSFVAVCALAALGACGPSTPSGGAGVPWSDVASGDGAGGDCQKPSDCGDNDALPGCKIWGCSQGSCFKLGAPDGAICHDGDRCQVGLCSAGACQNKEAQVCAKSEVACRVNACDSATGACVLANVKDGQTCDDGVSCTTSDQCTAGGCVGDVQACACVKSSDCPDDGDLCNGSAYCDAAKGTCAINPSTVVFCVSAKDTACVKNRCDPTTGACAMAVVPSGAPCDDKYACTTGDTCDVGICTPGTFTCECKEDADCQDDGDLCNGVPFCNTASGKCAVNPGTKVVCPTAADGHCMASLCEPQTGTCALVPINDTKPCGDGNICTIDETCKQGVCASATQVCACNTDADCAAKEDGDACNGTLFCNQALHQCALNPSTVVTCQSVGDTACQKATCQPTTGACALKAQPDHTACGDGDPCSGGASCLKGACVLSTTAPPSQCSCGSDADCMKFEDGDLCNGTLRCDPIKKRCAVNPSTVVSCAQDKGGGNPCSANTCDPTTGVCGVAAVAEGTACTLDAPCVKTASCQSGACKLATKLVCDDNNPCTVNACAAGGGCSFTPAKPGLEVSCYGGPAGTLGVGICKGGTTTCGEGGTANPCEGDQVPKGTDPCGGGNEDCDALTDEDCADVFKLDLLCGAGQQAKPGQPLGGAFRVLVRTSTNQKAANAIVSWTGVNGGAFAMPTTQTNGQGITTNYFTVGPTSGTTYMARATVGKATNQLNITAKADAAAPAYVFNYPTFCDISALKMVGNAVHMGTQIRVVTGGDGVNGSFWHTKPLTKNTSFHVKVDVNGYCRGYSVVLQSTPSGTSQGAGGHSDKGTPKLKNALVVQVVGIKTGGKYTPPNVAIYANGVALGSKGGIMPLGQNKLASTLWLDYDHATTKLRFFNAKKGAPKPKTPTLTVTKNIWQSLGSNGKPIYAGFTAANSSGGNNGTKYVEGFSYATE